MELLPRHGALAVFRRNLRVWRKLLGPAVAMNFGEPLLYLIGLGYGFGQLVERMDGMPYLAFLASGIVASSAMTTASFEGMYSVFTRMVPQRTYDALLATPLEVRDIVAGEILWCAVKGVFSSAAILLVATLLGITGGPLALLVLPAVFLAGLAFSGPAITITALSPSYDFFNYYTVLVLTPMLIVSGVFYPIETFPESVQAVLRWLPLAQAVELCRPLVLGELPPRPAVNLAVLGGFALVGYYSAVRLSCRRLKD